MIKTFVLCLFAVSAYGFTNYGRPSYHSYAPAEVKVVKVVKVEKVEAPEPYEFSYDITDEDNNNQARSESGDAYGHKKGSYSQKNALGLERVVEYVADGEGFRAIVKTNEPGTDSQSPANVEMIANPVEVKEAPKVYKKIIVAPSYGSHHGYAPRHHGYAPRHYGYAPRHHY